MTSRTNQAVYTNRAYTSGAGDPGRYVMIPTFYPCPGPENSIGCGADLYPRLWTAMRAQLDEKQKRGEHVPSAGWVVVTVSCACCGTKDMQLRVRYSTEPLVIEVKK